MQLNFTHLPSLPTLIQTFGYPLVWSIVFAESGLLVGVLLPGDSLLFVAGFLCSVPNTPLNIWVMTFGCFVAAFLGDSFGYYFGKKWGRQLFDKPDSKIFKKKHLLTAEEFFDRQGKVALILARFMPFVRTFAPIVAGIAAMRYGTFIQYNVLGGFVWAVGLSFLGYFIGGAIPPEQLDRYLIPITLSIMFVSLSPSIFHLWKARQDRE